MDARLDALLDDAGATHLQAPREALDREEQLIRDSVLRMGSLVEGAIREAARALVAHDAALALDVVKGDAIINEAQRGVSRLISVTIATQAWFVAAARVMAGPPTSRVSMSGDSRNG